MSQADHDCHILMVEDNPGDARLTQRLIGQLPQPRPSWKQVTTVADALTEIARGGYTVVLTDLDLPDSSGRETCHRLVGAAPDLPIVLLSGSQDEVALEEALAMGALDFLVKGEFDASDLHRVLRLAQVHGSHRRLIAYSLSLGSPPPPPVPHGDAASWSGELATSRDLLLTCQKALLHLSQASTASSATAGQRAVLQRLEHSTEALLVQMAALLQAPARQPPHS
jgi:CheY-like chemotaxis protein